jgi:hypothetical protein
MTQTIDELEARWMEAKRELGNQPRRRTGLRRTIQQILKDCIDAGQYIHSPGDRATLQWLAREVGDALFSITREYPSTVIKAARAGLMEVTPPHVFFSYTHDSPEHVQMVAELGYFCPNRRIGIFQGYIVAVELRYRYTLAFERP